jgi:hypothetical protein
MKKSIQVDIDRTTWPRPTLVPNQFAGAPVTQKIDLASALLMLGTLTMPNVLSPASPARFWAWVRYFLACARTDDLRITMDFASLDPHQKGILSDDFGVALSTQWLFDRFGGFADIVDGRRFLLQFAHLLPKKAKPPTAKVGPTKAPDFVIKDFSGRWHVLECKGTQSGRASRDGFLNDAIAQKHVVQITGRLRGERLAAGLSLSNEKTKLPTQLRVIDPEGHPLIELGENDSHRMDVAVRRIAVARALGSVGLGDIALELSLPADAGEARGFLQPNEIARLRAERGDRHTQALRQVRERRLESMRFRGAKYEGRRARFSDFHFDDMSGLVEIRVRQGVNYDLIEEIAAIDIAASEGGLNDRIEAYAADAAVKITAHGSRTTLTYGDIFFAIIDFKHSKG